MIDNITIAYNHYDVVYSMQIPKAGSNISYNLAEVFAELIKQTNANEEIVIEQLIDEFGYKKKGGEK